MEQAEKLMADLKLAGYGGSLLEHVYGADGEDIQIIELPHSTNTAELNLWIRRRAAGIS